ncbi:ferrous iron transport protein B [candidate division KSB1 bacterium]|nr:ferrous iron transport protein B [candidate division KSB1 bacterium]
MNTKHHHHPTIALVGQPNCGKSTIFNKVAGYRSVSTNFPGATVEYMKSHVNIHGQTCDIVDLPGIYSLTSLDQAAEEAKKYLLEQDISVIVNVIDASILGRSLELTLQLMELEVPMVVCLNMMDEAERKGILIDPEKLSKKLGVPVVTAISRKGEGIADTFEKAFYIIRHSKTVLPPMMSRHVESCISDLTLFLHKNRYHTFNGPERLLAIKLLESDPYFDRYKDSGTDQKTYQCQELLQDAHGQSADQVISAERHSMAMALFESAAEVLPSRQTKRDRLDDYLMHPIWGYLFMVLFLFLFFNGIFKLGAAIEEPLMGFLQNTLGSLANTLSIPEFWQELVNGTLQGIIGGIAIVLPYLFPFLLGLSVIEDLGYLPRVAFLMDNFMHKIGLHGTAVIPAILGYGCSVPAVMATRILSSPRDRFISSVVAVLIPCSARMTIIFGLVGYYLGGTAAFMVYLLNIFVISVTGALMSKMLPEDTPGFILEMPVYQIPSFKVSLAKTWLRMKDFIIVAWPLLIIGSFVLSIAEFFGWDAVINTILRPLTYILDLPAQVGTTLVFGILRKELSMLMLFNALDTHNVAQVMSSTQMLVFTLFVVFYIPCIATIGIMSKEIGWKKTVAASLITVVIAIILALAGRGIGFIVYGAI